AIEDRNFAYADYYGLDDDSESPDTHGARLSIPWRTADGPSGRVQLDFAYDEPLPDQPKLLAVPQGQRRHANRRVGRDNATLAGVETVVARHRPTQTPNIRRQGPLRRGTARRTGWAEPFYAGTTNRPVTTARS